MQALFLLLAISIVVLVVAGWAFLWAVNRGQFDDLDQHALDVLDDAGEPKSDRGLPL